MAVRIADLDDVLPIVVSGLVVVMLGSATPMPLWVAVGWLFRTIVLGIAVGTAGWLLFERAHSRAERNVFIAGTVALIGGTSSFLGLSPLLAGLMAGLLWVWLPGHADRVVRSDLQRVQHPLIVVLLLVAGASCEFSREAVWLAGPLVLFRLTGKLMGGWLAMRVQGLVTASELGLHLIAPGLLGIAVALHLLQAVRTPGMTAVLTAVVVATLASEALALVLRPTAGVAGVMRLLALAIILGTTPLVTSAAATAERGGGPGTALAIGFALIAASLTGELFERFRLPRISGYLFFGVVCGPYAERDPHAGHGARTAGRQRRRHRAHRLHRRTRDQLRAAASAAARHADDGRRDARADVGDADACCSSWRGRGCRSRPRSRDCRASRWPRSWPPSR